MENLASLADQRRRLGRNQLSKRDAGYLKTPRRLQQRGKPLGGRSDPQPGSVNIGQAVACRINGAWRRLPCDVDTERIGGAEPGPLTDQHYRECGAEDPADLVADRDAAALDDSDRAYT